MPKLYKIFNPQTKLYSMGTTIPKFSKFGKTWRKPSIKSHLILIKQYDGNLDVYKDCIIIEYDLIQSKETSIHEFLNE